ncbi:DUF4214 domain-containing protein [Undibacterium fentianense]|uniref:DUF4214 domain-containing protein n=1 Tax=Undibacterium fentianense TaxID=2828728 RepID=A0A941IFI6_9BURK|nr:DUF4214 domain-containing protein [Undibacterium fentianense]MBR7800761.1 DUF4214 domain-containing protein [Undibacterium fentianense]
MTTHVLDSNRAALTQISFQRGDVFQFKGLAYYLYFNFNDLKNGVFKIDYGLAIAGEIKFFELQILGSNLKYDDLSDLHWMTDDGANYVFAKTNQILGGGDGIDFLYASQSGNVLSGGTGDDWINGSNGPDVLHGDAGNDDLFGGKGDDLLYGDVGNDHLIDAEGNNALYGGDGDDILSIFGAHGDNLLEGQEGNDQLFAGEGKDTLRGGLGDDLLSGNGNDRLEGEEGNDSLRGGSYQDGGSGDDTLDAQGSEGAVIMIGDQGNDTVRGGFGDDTLLGGKGDDWLVGRAGNNSMEGGEGNDLIQINFFPIFGSLQNKAGNSIGSGGEGDDNLIFAGGDDLISGDNGSDALFGNSGRDTLDGGTGEDFLFGGLGNDQLNAGADDDFIAGSANPLMRIVLGEDPLQFFAFDYDQDGNLISDSVGAQTLGGGDDVIDGGAGFDTLFYSGERSQYAIQMVGRVLHITDQSGKSGTDQITNVEMFVFGEQAFVFDLNSAAADTYRLYQAAFGRTPDTDGLSYWYKEMQEHHATLHDVAQNFVSSLEFQRVYGSAPVIERVLQGFYQHILGRTPDLEGYTYWHDEYVMGRIDLAGILANFSDSPENRELTAFAIQQGVPLHIDLGERYDKTNRFVYGDENSNSLSGTVGNDHLFGLQGQDQLLGGAGDDILFGAEGNDELFGGMGNDFLFGGLGENQIDGGTGIDTAYFGSAIFEQNPSRDNFAFEKVNGVLTVTNIHNGESIDHLLNVERLAFMTYIEAGDTSRWGARVIAFDFDGSAGEIFKLYEAAAGNDLASEIEAFRLGELIALRDQGQSLQSIAEQLLTSSLFSSTYSDIHNSELFVQQLYQNSLGRAPDQEGLNYWKGQLNSGKMSPADLLVTISQGQEFHLKIVGSMLNGIEYWGVLPI